MTSSINSDPDIATALPPLHVRFWYSLRFGVVRRLLTIWAVTIVLAFAVIYVLHTYFLQPEEPVIALWSTPFFAILVIALLCEYMDSTLGMGYGTTLTPLLLVLPLGLDPLAVIPAILIS